MIKTASLPGISVIMPVFNYGNFIFRAIVSVMEQKMEEWELLIINDASTDNTIEVIHSFLPDNRIKCITLP
jgi:teichuronic acid biosynthesis glycosyltransferase TuaG